MRFLSFPLLALTLPLLADDDNSFTVPPDASWQVFSPLSPLYPANLDFSGGQCHITCPAPSYEVAVTYGYGGARGGLFAPSVMLDSVASVDITAWTPSTDRNTNGIHMFALTRVQSPIGLGNITGYAAVIIDMGANSGPGGVGRNGRLQIMLLNQEAVLTNFNQYLDFPFDPDHDYRLILVSRGETHTARVFDLSSPAAPVAQLVVQDDTLTAPGRTGFLIYNDRLLAPSTFDVTFDNFLAWDGTPPPLLIQPGTAPETMEVSSDLRRSMATDLQSTVDFSNPATPWQPSAPASATSSGGQLVTVFPIDGPRRFFRRKSL